MRKTKKITPDSYKKYRKRCSKRVIPGAEDRENELEEGETHGLGMVPKVSGRGTITGFAPENQKRCIKGFAPKASYEGYEEKESSGLSLAPQVIENEA